jgi:hypothetical protein
MHIQLNANNEFETILKTLIPAPDLPSLLLDWNRGCFLGVKRPELEADLSPPSSSEVKNEWNYTSTPL